MEQFERARLDSYFARIAAAFAPVDRPSSFLITHLLPERPSFVRAVGIGTKLRAVLPKPKSIDPAARREIERTTQCDILSRELFEDAEATVDYVESRAAGENVVLCDVGGYFAPTLDTLCDRFSGRILGVVEDTENGHKRYAERDKLPCPVVSVARSPLKDPEDFLVGQSVVFSTEALMRSRGDILHGRPALVIGFGKLGSSIARLLHAKGVQVTVHDVDPVRRTQALSQGFTVARDRDAALHGAGLVLCATGAVSLRGEDFSTLRNGAYVATVTSSEDELDLAALPNVYQRTPNGEHVTRYQTTGHYFYLLNGGNAVNFLHGASVGPFIFLVQAEILAGVRMLTHGDLGHGMHEVDAADRAAIAGTWLDYYNR
ncbi:adenosylhomocysteinase [Streptomyces sp. 8L]|uniref:adenosylhomocysteinase n=1 Tax=Streptomyces sp. 8L TaxID=2877242 RepID=UPI001CD62949|nr:adenosylhomocysteinase [Streptomyces sp. 8L]MCA1219876.1 adenosylhomocysteinase [Streptomyces sp. 8L]